MKFNGSLVPLEELGIWRLMQMVTDLHAVVIHTKELVR